jgi:hypothetical protein
MPVNSARISLHGRGHMPEIACNSPEIWAKTRTATEVVSRFGWRIRRLVQSSATLVTVARGVGSGHATCD